MTNPNQKDPQSEKIRREQRAFEEHWLWRELNTTPKEFFALVDDCIARCGVDRETFNQKVAEAKKKIEAHAMTSRHRQKVFNQNRLLSALRA